MDWAEAVPQLRRRPEFHVHFEAKCGGDSLKGCQGRTFATGLEPIDRSLAGAHTTGEFTLTYPGATLAS